MREKEIITSHTKILHQDACCDPVFNWENKQDFDFATRDLIYRPNDPDIKDKKGNIVWHNLKFEEDLKK